MAVKKNTRKGKGKLLSSKKGEDRITRNTKDEQKKRQGTEKRQGIEKRHLSIFLSQGLKERKGIVMLRSNLLEVESEEFVVAGMSLSRAEIERLLPYIKVQRDDEWIESFLRGYLRVFPYSDIKDCATMQKVFRHLEKNGRDVSVKRKKTSPFSIYKLPLNQPPG